MSKNVAFSSGNIKLFENIDDVKHLTNSKSGIVVDYGDDYVCGPGFYLSNTCLFADDTPAIWNRGGTFRRNNRKVFAEIISEVGGMI